MYTALRIHNVHKNLHNYIFFFGKDCYINKLSGMLSQTIDGSCEYK
jgi:hypothetical protein